MGTRGVFSLNRVIQKKYINDWVNLSNVWIDQIPNTGYFGGGIPGPLTSIGRISYSSDVTTIVNTATLNIARYSLAATGNSTAGYFGGGTSPGFPVLNYSTMDKLTYSSDTIVTVSGAALSAARRYLAATGNSTAGYFGGGFPGPFSTMDKVTYSSDTTAPLPSTGSLSIPRNFLAATGNSTTGYFGGGDTIGGGGGPVSTMDKLTYSTDTRTALPASGSLSVARYGLAATGNSTTGYFGGGGDGSNDRSTTDKLTYSTDTISTPPLSPISYGRSRMASTGNLSSGYFLGGTMVGFSPNNTIDKINYSTDVRTLSINLYRNIGNFAATSPKANGLTPQNNWRRFSDGTTTTNPASLPPATPTPQTFNLPTPDTGYFGGGGGPASTLYSTVDKLTYSSDTTAAVPGAPLGVDRYRLAATGNSTAGYFGGGFTGPFGEAIANVSRVNYFTDTSSATNSALFPVRHSLAAVGSEFFGYFGGGQTFPSPSASVIFYSLLDKVIYSNDSDVAIPAKLSIGRSGLAATGNSTSGYFACGQGVPSISPDIYSTIDKFTYSTETITTILDNFSYGRWNLAATGNSTAGYFGGGFLPSFFSFASVTTIDKLTYSTDTRTTLPASGSLSLSRSGLAATGNSTAGYFGGGTPGLRSTMDKVTYSSETTAAVPGAALSVSRLELAASSAKANALPQPTYPAPVIV